MSLSTVFPSPLSLISQVEISVDDKKTMNSSVPANGKGNPSRLKANTIILASRSKNVQSVTTSLVVPIVLLFAIIYFGTEFTKTLSSHLRFSHLSKPGIVFSDFQLPVSRTKPEMPDVGAEYYFKVVHFDDVHCFREPTETERFREQSRIRQD